MEETKVIYYVDDEDTPYLMKLSTSPGKVTLADFKTQLNRPYHKFFFKSMDDDFGVVKEEIADDASPLPSANGRVVCWVVTESSASGSDVGGSKADLESLRSSKKGGDDISIASGTSRASSRRHHRHHHHGSSSIRQHRHHGSGSRHNKHSSSPSSGLDSTTDISVTDLSATDADTTSFCETEDTMSQISRSTLTSLKPRRKVLTKTKPKMSRSLSCSTMTTSTMTDASMQILKVTLNMDAISFLGISIVGQTNEDGAGGIYVGSVMKGGAVAADGRIEPGDMLLEVNDISFDNMSNDDAVRTLREIVQNPGPISLTVAKCWDNDSIVPAFEPRLDPIRPIDPSAWVQATNQHTTDYGRPFTGSPTLSTMTSNSSPSVNSSLPDAENMFAHVYPAGEMAKLTLTTPMYRIAKALANANTGVEVKDRVWLKMTIPKSFIGSDLVEWLNTHVEGFIDRRHARKYAALMLKHGFIRHTVNKITFSEQCYYVFGDFKAAANSLPAGFNQLHLSDSGGDGDTLGPLPQWGSSEGEYSLVHDFYAKPQYSSSHSSSKSPSPDNKRGPSSYGSHGSSASSSASASTYQKQVGVGVSGGANNSNSNNASNGLAEPVSQIRHSISSTSGFTSVSQQHVSADRVSLHSVQGGGLGVSARLGQSRESFQQALDNPCEQFVDMI